MKSVRADSNEEKEPSKKRDLIIEEVIQNPEKFDYYKKILKSYIEQLEFYRDLIFLIEPKITQSLLSKLNSRLDLLQKAKDESLAYIENEEESLGLRASRLMLDLVFASDPDNLLRQIFNEDEDLEAEIIQIFNEFPPQIKFLYQGYLIELLYLIKADSLVATAKKCEEELSETIAELELRINEENKKGIESVEKWLINEHEKLKAAKEQLFDENAYDYLSESQEKLQALALFCSKASKAFEASQTIIKALITFEKKYPNEGSIVQYLLARQYLKKNEVGSISIEDETSLNALMEGINAALKAQQSNKNLDDSLPENERSMEYLEELLNEATKKLQDKFEIKITVSKKQIKRNENGLFAKLVRQTVPCLELAIETEDQIFSQGQTECDEKLIVGMEECKTYIDSIKALRKNMKDTDRINDKIYEIQEKILTEYFKDFVSEVTETAQKPDFLVTQPFKFFTNHNQVDSKPRGVQQITALMKDFNEKFNNEGAGPNLKDYIALAKSLNEILQDRLNKNIFYKFFLRNAKTQAFYTTCLQSAKSILALENSLQDKDTKELSRILRGLAQEEKQLSLEHPQQTGFSRL